MKKVLFIIPAYNHGGTNKSLQSILSLLNKEKYDIDVMSMSTIGPYKNILSEYKLLSRDLLLTSIYDSFSHIKKEDFIERAKKIVVKLLYKCLFFIGRENRIDLVYRISARKLGKRKYDTIIAMQEGRATHFASYIKGYKLAWVRCDYSQYMKLGNEDESCIYNKFDNIICVSNYTKDIFVHYYPELKDKCHGIHNMIDDITIKKMASETNDIDVRFNTENFRILSVGRLSKVKRFDIIPSIAKELKEHGYKFTWYIIGDGDEKEQIISLIQKLKVSDVVILLGEKTNPYPYFENSDLVVVTSLSEACPNVINEAKILNIPVVTTDFGSASEFIDNGVNGIITGVNDLTNVIREMIDDKEKYDNIKKEISAFDYSNEEIVSRIEGLLDQEVTTDD